MLDFFKKIYNKLFGKKPFVQAPPEEFIAHSILSKQNLECGANFLLLDQTSQLVNHVKVYDVSTFENAEVVYSIPVNNLLKGDVIEVIVDCEFTNDLPYVVSIVGGVILADNKSQVMPGKIICSFIGQNVDNYTIHHGVMCRSGRLIVEKDIVSGYVNFVVYAASTLNTDKSHYISVGYGSGSMSLRIEKQ